MTAGRPAAAGVPGAVAPVPAAGWRELLVAVAPLLAVGVVATTARRPALFRALVAEDGVLEWLQVAGFAATAVMATLLAGRLRRDRRPGAAVAALAAAVFVVIVGEELAWGQRLFAVSVPAVEAVNDQGDLTLHNIGGGLRLSQAGMLGLALAGVAAVAGSRVAAVRDRIPLLALGPPPPWLAGWFGLAAAYAAWRLVAGTPSYEAAKLSEVAELALAIGTLVVAAGLRRAVISDGGRPAYH